MQRKLSFLLASMLLVLVITVLSITSEQLQSHAENVQIIFDPIFGHNHNGTNSAKLATNSVNTTQLVANSVTDAKISGPISVVKGGTGLSSLGSANQVLRVNSGGTALEYATPSSVSGQDSDMDYKLSTTIGDYSTPSSATGSSTGSTTTPTTVTITGTSLDLSLSAHASISRTRTGLTFNTGAIPVGESVTTVSFWLKKVGSPTGTAYARVYDSSGTQVTEFGSIDVATLTTSYVKYTFNSASRTIVAGDRLVIVYDGTDGSNYIQVQYAQASGHDADLTRGVGYEGTTWVNWTTGDDMHIEYIHNVVTIHPASNAVDSNTSTWWQSNSTDKPSLRLDLGANKDLAQLAVNLNRTYTTATTLKIYSSNDTSFTSGEVIAYVNVSDLTDDTWRFILNNRLPENKRYMQVEAQENPCVLVINEVKYREITDWSRHFHAKRDVTTANSFNDSN